MPDFQNIDESMVVVILLAVFVEALMYFLLKKKLIDSDDKPMAILLIASFVGVVALVTQGPQLALVLFFAVRSANNANEIMKKRTGSSKTDNPKPKDIEP